MIAKFSNLFISVFFRIIRSIIFQFFIPAIFTWKILNLQSINIFSKHRTIIHPDSSRRWLYNNFCFKLFNRFFGFLMLWDISWRRVCRIQLSLAKSTWVLQFRSNISPLSNLIFIPLSIRLNKIRLFTEIFTLNIWIGDLNIAILRRFMLNWLFLTRDNFILFLKL